MSIVVEVAKDCFNEVINNANIYLDNIEINKWIYLKELEGMYIAFCSMSDNYEKVRILELYDKSKDKIIEFFDKSK